MSSGKRKDSALIRSSEVHDFDFEIRQVTFEVASTEDFLAKLRDLSNAFGVTIVCFNADMMAGQRHVISAMLHAERAQVTGSCISGSFEIEALLYAAGSRQCQDAVKFGIHQGLNSCYICIRPPEPTLWTEIFKFMEISSDNWEDLSDKKIQLLVSLFGITDQEISVSGRGRVKDLVLERVALLEVSK